jgi:hypothetical protein
MELRVFLCFKCGHIYELNYAACHDCVLLPETSCEFSNVLLDRVAVVGKPESPKLGLMGEITSSLLLMFNE